MYKLRTMMHSLDNGIRSVRPSRFFDWPNWIAKKKKLEILSFIASSPTWFTKVNTPLFYIVRLSVFIMFYNIKLFLSLHGNEIYVRSLARNSKNLNSSLPRNIFIILLWQSDIGKQNIDRQTRASRINDWREYQIPNCSSSI